MTIQASWDPVSIFSVSLYRPGEVSVWQESTDRSWLWTVPTAEWTVPAPGEKSKNKQITDTVIRLFVNIQSIYVTQPGKCSSQTIQYKRLFWLVLHTRYIQVHPFASGIAPMYVFYQSPTRSGISTWKRLIQRSPSRRTTKRTQRVIRLRTLQRCQYELWRQRRYKGDSAYRNRLRQTAGAHRFNRTDNAAHPAAVPTPRGR